MGHINIQRQDKKQQSTPTSKITGTGGNDENMTIISSILMKPLSTEV